MKCVFILGQAFFFLQSWQKWHNLRKCQSFFPPVSLTFLFVLFNFFALLRVIFESLEVVKSQSVAHLVQENDLFINTVFTKPVIHVHINGCIDLSVFKPSDSNSHPLTLGFNCTAMAWCKSLPELVTFMSMLGENTTVLQLAVDSVYIRLCDSHNYLLNHKL